MDQLRLAHVLVQFAWYQRLHTSSEVNAVFVQQTMKTAASDEELAFKQKEKDVQMCHAQGFGMADLLHQVIEFT